MTQRGITLWVDERWCKALEKHLLDGTVAEKLEEQIDELVNQLPENVYKQISGEIWQEQQQAKLEAEAARRFAVFRIRQRGNDSVFRIEENCDVLLAAKKLRSYMQEFPSNVEVKFADTFRKAVPIQNREFNEAVIERLSNSERVTGAFDINMDDGTFSSLHSTTGWQTFTRRSAISAAYFAMKKQGEPWDARLHTFMSRLQGKQINPDYEYTILRGEHALGESDIRFSDEIIQDSNCLEFYMEVNFDADELFGTSVRSDTPPYYLNVYSYYDMETEQVADMLNIILVNETGDVGLHYPLSQEEKAVMLPKMDAFCQMKYGQSLADYREQYLEEVAQEQKSAPEMQM